MSSHMPANSFCLLLVTCLSALQGSRSLLYSPSSPLALRPPQLSLDRRRGLTRHGCLHVTCSAGRPSWIPWTGTNGRMVDTERDDFMQRNRCRLCRGTGTISCRLCSGKGYKALRSRTLRNATDPLFENEVLSCDATTGLMRAVEISVCARCEKKGKIACSLCGGSGGRETNVTFRNFTRMTAGDSKGEDEDEDVYRYTGGRR
ncbi:hypothetical protein GUITHDRAFT_153734 [Guillardia theta CCMP2712]|uniref:Uncharacterized protein n=2 Tax=Guillardia theta TaxID=55529 RepID=L1IZR8_GUITC|nr:hypothetical protein GUITHDRAFT_153734 [Guillardia theta CCMP2712]EKX41741.1 hypothetical protein GUITHDRAFT_153734 [Guillardia theta CCMP2712]|mmetsp:Transcript_25665/g.84750  ORF Transcript_25665/g.84750 Transcript_25665/m.84750 type:complete len:203 (+) Transcript_25665:127-735(+)|eukprot:XP_005828721.1 hypothetical protein GUITHDRAFT_153734 [Guillardia theta CCMP2712]